MTARMLASPVRTCSVTEIRLPNEFLTPYIICKDPKTDVPWQIPSNIHPNPSEQALEDELGSTKGAGKLNQTKYSASATDNA